MGLDKNAVDLFEIHDAGLVTDGFDERAQTQVAGAAQQTFAGTNDERQRFGREGVMAQPVKRSVKHIVILIIITPGFIANILLF